MDPATEVFACLVLLAAQAAACLIPAAGIVWLSSALGRWIHRRQIRNRPGARRQIAKATRRFFVRRHESARR